MCNCKIKKEKLECKVFLVKYSFFKKCINKTIWSYELSNKVFKSDSIHEALVEQIC